MRWIDQGRATVLQQSLHGRTGQGVRGGPRKGIPLFSLVLQDLRVTSVGVALERLGGIFQFPPRRLVNVKAGRCGWI
jgi:hypothetical protein